MRQVGALVESLRAAMEDAFHKAQGATSATTAGTGRTRSAWYVRAAQRARTEAHARKSREASSARAREDFPGQVASIGGGRCATGRAVAGAVLS